MGGLWRAGGLLAGVVILVFMVSVPAAAQDVPVPANLQTAIFSKIFKYCSTLEGKKIKVAIVNNGDHGDLATEIKAGFDKAKVDSAVVTSSSVPANTTVVYVTPGALDAIRGKKVLSITGVESYVRSGKVAVGVTLAGKKPKILVNMKRLEEEGHQLSSHVLRLADTIR